MAAYNIYEAKTGFSALVEKAVNGEEVVIAKAGKPVVKLVPIAAEKPPEQALPKRRRPAPGSVTAKGWDVAAMLKCLDEPWNEEEQRAFGMID